MALCLPMKVFLSVFLIVHACVAVPLPTFFELVNVDQSSYPTASRELIHDCAYECLYSSYTQNRTFCFGFYFNETGDCELDLQIRKYLPKRAVPQIPNYFSLLQMQSEEYTSCPVPQAEATQSAAFFAMNSGEVYRSQFEDNLYLVVQNPIRDMHNCISEILYYSGMMPLTIHSVEENNFIADLTQHVDQDYTTNPVYLLPGIATGESGAKAIKWAGNIPTTVFDFPWASGQPLLENGHTCIVGDSNGKWTTANCSSTPNGICIGKINQHTLAKEDKNSNYLKVGNYEYS